MCGSAPDRKKGSAITGAVTATVGLNRIYHKQVFARGTHVVVVACNENEPLWRM
jgi:hypothetical protein